VGRSGVLAFDQIVPFQPKMRAGAFVSGHIQPADRKTRRPTRSARSAP
jgi:hypothetical protein